MAASDAKPIPIKNTAFRVTFAIYDQEGDLVTGAAGLDSEVSLDGGTFADCTNEATEIATASGIYFLDISSAEMNADTVAVIVKTSSVNAKTTVLVLYPAENTDIPVNVTAVSGDTTAADNLESDYDGNGYAKAASSIGTTTAVTNGVTVSTNNDKTGYALSGAGVTAVQSGLSTLTAAQVNTEVDTALSDVGLTPTVTGRIDAAVSSRLASSDYTTPPTALAIAAAVWSSATRSLTEISATLRNQIADNLIRRSFTNAAASADGDSKTGRSLLGVVARLANRSAIVGTTLTVYEADDSTALYTQTLTTDASAEPVVSADTA
jgi:hypothetical protein